MASICFVEIRQEGEELTDSGISYLLSNGEEIIYCCNFYDDRLCDRLLLVEQINVELAHSCYSLVQDKYIIEPQVKIHLYN